MQLLLLCLLELTKREETKIIVIVKKYVIVSCVGARYIIQGAMQESNGAVNLAQIERVHARSRKNGHRIWTTEIC